MKTKYFYYVAQCVDDNNKCVRAVNVLQAIDGVTNFLLHDNRACIAKKFGVPIKNVAIINHMEITKNEAEIFRKEAEVI